MNEKPVSLIQISRQIGIGPATLSNWQNRFEDFPAPRELVGQRRLYSLDDIRAFMARHDLKVAERKSESVRNSVEADAIFNTMDILRSHVGVEGGGLILAAAIAVVAIESPDALRDAQSASSVIRNVIQELSSDLVVDVLPESLWTSREFERVVEEWQKSDSLEVDRITRSLRNSVQTFSQNRFSAQFVTPTGMARLIHKLAPGIDVLDMCCGVGSILSEYKRGSRRIVGQEINASTALLHRLLNRAECGHAEILCEDSLATCHEDWMQEGFFSVVAVPPLGLRLREDQIVPTDLRWTFSAQAKRNNADDFWIQNALAYLRTSSGELAFRGVLVLRPGWFFEGHETAMRDALVKSGVVEAVVSLGGGLLRSTQIPLCILILRKGGSVNRPVRMVDASEVGLANRSVRLLSNTDADQIVAAVNGGSSAVRHSRIKVKDVSVSEILENSAILAVSRYTQEPVEEVISLGEAIEKAESALQELQKTLDEFKKQLSGPLLSSIEKMLPETNSVQSSHLKVEDMMEKGAGIESLFKTRQPGRSWTRDEILYSDIVIGLVGGALGQAMLGNDFVEHDVKWNKIWILRPHPDFVLPEYLLTWARFGGLMVQLRPLASGTTVQMVAKRDIFRITVPIPDQKTQEQIAKWGIRVLEQEKAFEQMKSREADFRAASKKAFEIQVDSLRQWRSEK
jgi:hypothetical protein